MSTMVKSLKIKLPKGVEALPEEQRREIMGVLAEAMRLPAAMPVHTRGGADEHNMWSRSDNPLIAQTEDGLYEALVDPWHSTMVDIFVALDLPMKGIVMEQAFSREFREWEGLQKARSSKTTMSDLISAGKAKREAFIKYMQDMNPFNSKQLAKLDALMKKKLPKFVQIAEEFMVQAGFLGKIRNVSEQNFIDLTGAIIESYPSTIKASEDQDVVLTVKEQQKAAAEGRTVKVLPLTPQEARAVQHATSHAADKITDISERHRAGVRQMVLRAQRERWSAGKLAQELFDLYGEQNRDWRRVAITELSMAMNDAYLTGLPEGETVIGMGAENACKYCTQYVIGKSFTVTHELPKENDYNHEMNFVWAGKSNYGRRVAEYIPAVPMHPNCRCRWHRVSKFYKMVDGKPVLKTTAELINEELKKKGLPPDPNLK